MASNITVNGKQAMTAGCGETLMGFPNVCKTPAPPLPPIPLPYPNMAEMSDLIKGSTSVLFEGSSVAIDGAQLKKSSLDQQGKAGGIKSGKNGHTAEWSAFSFDVKVEGKGVCRKGDLLTSNGGNCSVS